MTHSAPVACPAIARMAVCDAFHAARAGTSLVSRLYAEAMGDEYPEEVGPYSSCDWSLLGLLVTRLKLRPGQLLVDVGCGTGGVGLWLARALNVRLVGIDLSPFAVSFAATRRTSFNVPENSANFHVATMEATGLATGCAQGVLCIDALGFAANRAQVLSELGRTVAPGGRLILTTVRRDGQDSIDRDSIDAALEVEDVDDRPAEPKMWKKLYDLWISHERELRRELGDRQAANMLREAHRKAPMLAQRHAVLVTLRAR
ncbi:class I SAM-dependent methyltransferase [Amycolatopsis halotolerans]|uniref:Class I SAM-dependent methyltransferase n=1 Tax=Amycolatopsis halotolerans TaxID=330083 RepID=A0ABV7QB19_9PSEU